MKKVFIIVLSFLLAVKANSAFASENRCDAITDVHSKIVEIQDFAKVAGTFSAADYKLVVKKLRTDTDSLANKVAGCDSYSDKMLGQIYGAIDLLNKNINKYTNS